MKISRKIYILCLICIAAIITAITFWPKNTPKEVLLWGGDSSSGAPFVFRNPADPRQMVGLDVDVMNAIAAELGMKAEFVQNVWDGLVPGLISKNYDLALSGFEIVEERKAKIGFSEAYYIASEKIIVAADNNSIHSLKDLANKKVGTLPNSYAARLLKQIPSINVVYYPEEVNAFADLADNTRLDAVLIDGPIAQYYAAHNPGLKILQNNVGELKYGIGIRKDDTVLKSRVDGAITELIESGKLRLILEKWGLWNLPTAHAWNENPTAQTAPDSYLEYLEYIKPPTTITGRLKQYASFLPLLGRGAIVTIEISLLSMALAAILGLFIALLRLYGGRFLSMLAVAYIELVRGTPLLIQLYIIFYGLPIIGIKFSPFLSALIGLGLNYAANEAENYRAGILSVPKHQMDAALALGMSRIQALRYVVLPQAMRLVIPPITNDFISLIKDSSIVSVITLVELTTVYSQLATTYFDYLGIGLLVALMYFCIGLPFSFLARHAEKRFSQYTRLRKSSPVSKT